MNSNNMKVKVNLARQGYVKVNVNMKFDLGVVGHVVAVDGELDGVAH